MRLIVSASSLDALWRINRTQQDRSCLGRLQTKAIHPNEIAYYLCVSLSKSNVVQALTRRPTPIKTCHLALINHVR